MHYARSGNGKVVDVLRVHPSTIWPDRANEYRACSEDVQVGWLDDGQSFTAPPPVPLPAQQAAAVMRIDADVDAIYGVVIGNRQAEYEAAERQAQEFADGGFAGQAPGMVASWATAKGWTAQQAAEDILAVSAQWRGAQEQIRAQRLLRKEQARTAASASALATILQAWAGFVAAVRVQLGLGAA